MRRLIIIFCILITFNCHLISQTNSLQNSLFWEISGNGLKESSYLFGTIHMLPKADYRMPITLKERLENSSALILEADIKVPLKQQIELVRKTLLPNNTSLKDFMSEEEYSNFLSYLIDSLDINKKKVNNRYIHIKPFFIHGLILKEVLGKIKVYENELSKLAKKNDIKLLGLETLEDQMKIIDSIPIKEQIKSLDINHNIIQEYYSLLNLYKKQDLHAINEEMKKEEDFADFENYFLISRNQKWLPKLEALLKEDNAFIAVGAAHLIGNNGLINLLSLKGYTLTPIIVSIE